MKGRWQNAVTSRPVGRTARISVKKRGYISQDRLAYAAVTNNS